MPEYVLTYFGLRGRAEISRLIFAAAGVAYTDERITDWPALKPTTPLGFLPVLSIDGFKLSQSLSIARYLANEFNLAGKDNLTKAQANAVVDTVFDLFSAMGAIRKSESKEEATQLFVTKTGPEAIKKIEKIIELYGSNGFSAGDSLTWADLYIFDITSTALQFNPNFLENAPRIQAVRKSVESNSRIADYLKTRPQTEF